MAKTCKSCGAPIIWAKSEHGKPLPLDAKPEKRFVIFIGEPTITVRAQDTYTTHFATCPQADQWRKP